MRFNDENLCESISIAGNIEYQKASVPRYDQYKRFVSTTDG